MYMALFAEGDGDEGDGHVDGDGCDDDGTRHFCTTSHYEGLTSR